MVVPNHFPTPGHVPSACVGPIADIAIREFLRAMPKAELHCHLFGAVRQNTFTELAERSQAPLTRSEIDGFYTRDARPVGVLRVLRALDRHLIRRADDLHRIAYEYLEDARSHGVLYSEFFWNPTGTVRDSGIPYAAAQDAIVAALNDAEHDHGIVSRLIPSIDREAEPRAAVEMVEWMLANRRPEVIGIGMDYREPKRPPELFWKAYRMARGAGLKVTAHAGEFGMPWENIETALEILECERIDHGYTIIERPALARVCAERGTVFTVVPTNSYYLRTLEPERWALDHPIRQMANLGLKIHPNSDDPALHQIDPSGVWELMYTHFGFNMTELRTFMLNGLDGAWIDASTRQRWSADWTKEYDRLRASLLGGDDANGPAL